MNEIFVIQPYRLGQGPWVFDDNLRGIKQEPFIGEVNTIIDGITKHIPNAKDGFNCYFSAKPMPEAIKLKWIKKDFGGNWYRWVGHRIEGWLCSVLFSYFKEAPKFLYVRVEKVSREVQKQIKPAIDEQVYQYQQVEYHGPIDFPVKEIEEDVGPELDKNPIPHLLRRFHKTE